MPVSRPTSANERLTLPVRNQQQQQLAVLQLFGHSAKLS
jgi:hypothetical protein